MIIITAPEELRQTGKKDDWIKDRKLAYENTIKSHNYNKKLFDKNQIQHKFNLEDTVYVENGNKLDRRKLDELYIGPLKKIEKISDKIYKINMGKKRNESTLFHVTKLIPMRKIEKEDNE